MAKRFYRCENEWGSDPCELAKSNRKIPEADVVPALDGSNPKCPGKTLSGKPCGRELVPLGKNRIPHRGWPWWLCRVGVGVLVCIVVMAILWKFFFPSGGRPVMGPVPDPLVFPRAQAGRATAAIRIHNIGDGELEITRIEVRPSMFSPLEDKIRVAPNDAHTLSIRFESTSAEMLEGQLVLHSNAPGSPATVTLIANFDPWWVHRKLETSSKVLLTKQ